jgi:NAD+ kinase
MPRPSGAKCLAQLGWKPRNLGCIDIVRWPAYRCRMAKRRLLVVYKMSQLDLYRAHEPSSIAYLRTHERELLERFQYAHEANAQAIARVRETINSLGFEASYVYRADHESGREYDLVVSVGGDGTLLDVSHCVRKTPMLGVNSSPDMSVGHFCATDADGFEATLNRWVSGDIFIARLNRLQVSVNGKQIPTPVLNEMLYAHTVPGGVSRYVLRCGNVEEVQKSSGIWIATAAGSTAAIRSAGGTIMEAEDTRLQYIVREPYQWAGTYSLLQGMSEVPLEIMSKMRTAALYLDGHRHQIEISLGSRVVVATHPNPLNLLGFEGHAP